MTSDFPSIRNYLKASLNSFPWLSPRQTSVIWAYGDHLVAGREPGRQGLLRAGMTQLTDRKLQYQLKKGRYYVEQMFTRLNQQIAKLDRRRVYQLAFDDTNEERTGKQVFAAAYQYDHSHSSVFWGQVLVDRVLIGEDLINLDFRTYLPESYVVRTNRPATDFQTKIQQVMSLVQQDVAQLRSRGLATKKIWVTTDCWYACQLLTTLFRDLGVNFLIGLKKDAHCHWFGATARLDEIFRPTTPWASMTDPESGKIIYYQAKILNLTCHGRCKVFAVRRGKETKIRY